jgi:predicted O-methyltransferase YrrM
MPIIKSEWLRSIVAKYVKLFIHRFMKSRVDAAHQEYSMVYSQHDNPGKPNEYLIDLTLRAALLAKDIDLSLVKSRTSLAYPDPNKFPDEHYRLLASLISLLKPKIVIEIGMERGISCLAMKNTLLAGSKIHTFDIKVWSEMNSPVLRQEDFDDSLEQHLVDITTKENQDHYQQIFEQADFIFMDAAKDGNMENAFLSYFQRISFRNKPILMIDDIHNWNMLAIWRSITKPKMDVSSFGHFTGTGLVQL